ncbi:intermediate conductance calcium-activated potassium channel protein 4 isoform X1 [Pundamilia nyererei]|uniref:Intermediate conductance calcium-activated potassium channel protein 4 isoform X1 n=1 Tax=Pundamilia nyererei TaxID=303518 RepID=A0A3B4F0W4_9CICH|nr:PREDICTED: intermediate conductance calcium-activated potassium channel protein 4 isoform X1 [Pundamilia nyererei]
MEMTNRSLHGDSKVDCVSCDGLINRNRGDSADVSVPLTLPGKRTAHMEGDDLYRLRDRKLLLEDKKRLCAWTLGTAVFGILLMIIHAEICPYVYTPGSNIALIINCSISLSTGCLLILIIAFHYKDIQLFIIDHNQVDWRIAMTSHRIIVITLELLVCVIHPVGSYWGVGLHVNSSSTVPTPSPLCVSSHHGETLMDMELLLSVLMFLRLYLVHRAILLHSKVLLSASYRSIGSLNNINFTFRFVLKVLMNKHPARMLLVFILFFWLTVSWMLTLCERQTKESTGHMDTALWLIAITFLTVGYGDVAPKTNCGKAVCLFTGVMLKSGKQGVACTAMLVAIVTEKLALNKGEKHVHFFMMDIQISKRIRHAAANVLRECWLLHRANVTKGNRGEHRKHQRCLLEAIRVFRHLRLKQRKLRDYVSEMVDLPKMQMIMCDLSANWNNSYRELEQRILSMEQKLDELSRCFQQTSDLLSQVVRHRNPEIR